ASWAHKRVQPPFRIDACRWSMPRKHTHVWGQCIQPRDDTLDDRFFIATEQIGAPDATMEEGIAREQRVAAEQADAAGSMPRRMDYLQPERAHCDDSGILQF